MPLQGLPCPAMPTFAPAHLIAARDVLLARSPLTAGDIGIVGDDNHNGGYHLGKSDIANPATDYSLRTARDVKGATDAASAIDVGNDDWRQGLRDFSVWVVAQCRAGATQTTDIREVIYSPDGVTVWRWDRERGVKSLSRREGDYSHRTHTHIATYRDSATRRHLYHLFTRYFDSQEVIDVDTYAVLGIQSGVIRQGAQLFTKPNGAKVGTPLAAARRVLLAARDKDTAWYQVDGGGDGIMRWVHATDVSGLRDESYNAGVNAAKTGAAGAAREPIG